MATRQIQEERVQNLNEKDVVDGDYVLYWMQSSQRAEQNHVLEYAAQRANELDQRLLVGGSERPRHQDGRPQGIS